jgi:hypothetical protein
MYGTLRKEYVDKVLVEIDYDGFWNVTIMNGGAHVVSGHGKRRYTVINPFEEVWELSVKANKLDDSSRVLTIRVITAEGSILCNSSTSEKASAAYLTMIIN